MMGILARAVLLACYAALVAFLSLLPPSGGFVLPLPHADKIVHFVAYAILAMLAAWTFQLHSARKAALVGTAIGLGAFLYGFCLEVAQGLTGLGRSFSLGDCAANAVGIILAITLVLRARARVFFASLWKGVFPAEHC